MRNLRKSIGAQGALPQRSPLGQGSPYWKEGSFIKSRISLRNPDSKRPHRTDSQNMRRFPYFLIFLITGK